MSLFSIFSCRNSLDFDSGFVQGQSTELLDASERPKVNRGLLDVINQLKQNKLYADKKDKIDSLVKQLSESYDLIDNTDEVTSAVILKLNKLTEKFVKSFEASDMTGDGPMEN